MSKKHAFFMLLCCLVGLGAAAAFFLLWPPGQGVPANRVLAGLMLLLCPLSHLLMMRFMVHKHETGYNGQDAPGSAAGHSTAHRSGQDTV